MTVDEFIALPTFGNITFIRYQDGVVKPSSGDWPIHILVTVDLLVRDPDPVFTFTPPILDIMGTKYRWLDDISDGQLTAFELVMSSDTPTDHT